MDAIIGREAELHTMREFLLGARPARALVLAGEPGIGKTTLWEAGLAAAAASGLRALAARPSESELQLPYVAVGDLLAGVDVAGLHAVPDPQRRALEAALLRVEPGGTPSDRFAVAAGLTSAVRALAHDERVVIALDDLQWLDRSSADALSFAARRLHGDPVRFLLARRPGALSTLERALRPAGVERLTMTGLSLGAMRHLLVEQLALTLPRSTLRRVFEATGGNPLFALELGRVLLEEGVPGPDEDLPLPEALGELFGLRVKKLPARLRRVLLMVALSGELELSRLANASGADQVDETIERGLLRLDGERLRPSHPLLAAAVRRQARPRERRDVHRTLADLSTDEPRRTRHLALATGEFDAEVATLVERAARDASARGAMSEAVELAEHAVRLTPPDSSERSNRLLELSGYLSEAGAGRQTTYLLSPLLRTLPPSDRARAYLLLADGVVTGLGDIERYHGLALAESDADPALHALVLARKAAFTADVRVERVEAVRAWAEEALHSSAGRERGAEAWAVYALAWAHALGGEDLAALQRRYPASANPAFLDLERIAGQRSVWRGELDSARMTFARAAAFADEHGLLIRYALVRLHQCELELRLGDWRAAARLLDEWDESAREEVPIWPMYERCRALCAAIHGLPQEADTWTARTLERVDATGNRWDRLEALRARGIGALLEHAPERAVESLREVWEHCEREGIDDPGAFPVAPELIEALVEVGARDEGRRVHERLVRLAREQVHPWGLATVKRNGALVDPASLEQLAEAADGYRRLGLRFDEARSLLLLGRGRRRLKRWGDARRALEQARDRFAELEAAGWVDETQAELDRVAARRPPAAGALTPAERRVADLAAEGLSNKAIAAALFVSVYTVEAHLSHAYAKLGIRSRAQLARRLAALE